MRDRKKPFKYIYLILVLLFLYTPILYTVLYSFNESTLGAFSGFTLKWYGYVFTDSGIMDAVLVTFSIALLASCFSTVVGTFAAIGFFSMKNGPRMLWNAVNNIPVINPDIVTGISTMLIFAYVGLGGGYFSLFWHIRLFVFRMWCSRCCQSCNRLIRSIMKRRWILVLRLCMQSGR